MQRRSFIKSLLTLAIAPHYLPGAGRLWKATLEPSPSFPFDPLLFVRETGRFLPSEIFSRVYGKSPWMSLVERGTYPDHLGITVEPHFTYDESDRAGKWDWLNT